MPIPIYVEIIKNFSDNVTVTDSLTISRSNRSYSLNITDSITLTDTFITSYSHTVTSYPVSITDNITLSENVTMIRVQSSDISNVVDNITITDEFTAVFSKRNVDFVTYSSLKVNGVIVSNVQQIELSKYMNEFDATSNFTATFNNYTGRYADDFSLNDEVTIFADLDINSPTTKIFTGIIEDIKYTGSELNEKLIISGRDYGAILQDVMVSPRIFKNTEVSSIINSLMAQNAAGLGITWNNVDTTTITVDKIIFNNKSLFDCIKDLAELAGFYFYIDVDKDLHFEERNSISSGQTFSRGNVLSSYFTNTDADIFNRITVYGDRVLTGYREAYPTVTTGSVYVLDSKPSNVLVVGSNGTPAGFVIQPGGVFQFDNPETDDVKWLVDYEGKKVILTNGTAAGNNIGWAGSGVIIDYQRSTPIISIKQDTTSQTSYGRKDKVIIDKNIKTLSEAFDRATTYLSEHKDPKIMGDLDIYGVIDITPGHTCIVDLPFNNINTQTYTILEARYVFNINNNLSNKVLKLKLNKKVKDFVDYFKEQELRLRALEGAGVDTSIIETVTATGSVGVQVSAYNCISRSIGSSFYFNVTNHDLLENTSSLLGDVRAGSVVISYP